MTDTRTAIDAMPAPALACVKLLACPVCQPRGAYPQYVPADWMVGVCPACVGDPTVLARLEYIRNDALARGFQAEQTWDEAHAAAPERARQAMDELIAARKALDAGTLDKAAFLAQWEAVKQIDGVPLLVEAWKLHTATVNACRSTLDATQPHLDALQAALTTLEQQP